MSAALAVMDAEIANAESLAVSDAYQAERLPKLREARAAVAELVGAATEYYAKHGRPISGEDRIGAALARVQGEGA